MIIQGDCLDKMQEFEDNYFDLILTDPPYGVDYQSSRRIDRLRKSKILNDKEPYVTWLREAYRLLKPSGCMLCFYRWDVASAFHEEAHRVGFKVKSEVIWDKGIHGMGDLLSAFSPQHESIMFCTKGGFKFPNKRPPSIVKVMRVSPDKLLHPNEKPVDLLKKLISWTSKEGDRILDPFCGSGTTIRAAKDLNRECVGIEISPEYVEIIKSRERQEVLL